MPPGLSHVFVGLALQGGVALLVMFVLMLPGAASVLTGGALTLAIGLAFSTGFYTGRERRQMEEEAGTNRVPPWRWQARALRDIGWPFLAGFAMFAMVALGSR